jgi:hypothetical protein
MVMLRTKSVSTKVTATEFAQLSALTGPLSMSEWVRAVLLRAAQPDPTDRAVLAELVALRSILVNLHFALANGHGVTVEQMQSLIDRADQDKWTKANERLAAVAGGAKA